MFTLITKFEIWGIFRSIKFDHFNFPLILKMNRHICFALGFYTSVYGKSFFMIYLNSLKNSKKLKIKLKINFI